MIVGCAWQDISASKTHRWPYRKISRLLRKYALGEMLASLDAMT